jgi:hypothetical protein
MFCGAGLDQEPTERVAWLFYRCPYCSGVNYRFARGAGRHAPRAS